MFNVKHAHKSTVCHYQIITVTLANGQIFLLRISRQTRLQKGHLTLSSFVSELRRALLEQAVVKKITDENRKKAAKYLADYVSTEVERSMKIEGFGAWDTGDMQGWIESGLEAYEHDHR